jgi:hypothetical protein
MAHEPNGVYCIVKLWIGCTVNFIINYLQVHGYTYISTLLNIILVVLMKDAGAYGINKLYENPDK